MSDISFFLPTRKGSNRVENKNTRSFAGIDGGLLALKLSQLIGSKLIGEIILSTNDELCIEIASKFKDPRLRIIERPDQLCLDTTPLTALIKYVPEVVRCEHVIWGHVTTPFVEGQEYDRIIDNYFKGCDEGYDSLVTVKELQNFLIDPKTGEMINSLKGQSGRWPRTQDLDLLYEVNHVAFVTSLNVYEDLHDRIGKRKRYHVQDTVTSFDIDWGDDFLIAESIYEKHRTS
ncbi:acylneuraminate cytidylyltransferase [Roseivirga sp. 4D4]|uniref:acylneuraminate cytidylyltransferase family protein n=1 Tax=Roseivirga sp. 4D4 TaxID=1889784 RepID=UPI000853CC2C|nr:acylneuraminate cytidylyltransferase [Roseivirga sp. 4D4]OEK01637.1 acylneuraminate cytidylyltransferase [Roseivirga sp. 4D4]